VPTAFGELRQLAATRTKLKVEGLRLSPMERQWNPLLDLRSGRLSDTFKNIAVQSMEYRSFDGEFVWLAPTTQALSQGWLSGAITV
jgi:hypothetical protein